MLYVTTPAYGEGLGTGFLAGLTTRDLRPKQEGLLELWTGISSQTTTRDQLARFALQDSFLIREIYRLDKLAIAEALGILVNCFLILFVLFGFALAQTSNQTHTARPALDWVPNTNYTGIDVALANGWYEKVGVRFQLLPHRNVSPDVLVGNAQAEMGASSFCVTEGAAWGRWCPGLWTGYRVLLLDSGVYEEATDAIRSRAVVEASTLYTNELVPI